MHEPSEQAVLEHLTEVLDSEAFLGAERPRALLDFVVRSTLRGDGDRLKEYTLGVDALGRGAGFDPRTDPIVRAEVSRLRRRLEQYYAGEGRAARLRFVLPKGGYAPRFVPATGGVSTNSVHADTVAVMPRSSRLPWGTRAKWFAFGTAAGVLVTAAAATSYLRGLPAARMEPRALTLDVELRAPGMVDSDVGTDIVLSPDATRAVFVARGADRRGRLFVFRLADSNVTELEGTDGARAPFFSPDGAWVGFWADGAVKKIALDGGAPLELARSPDLLGASWAKSGDIVAVTSFGVLSRIPSAGSAATVILDVSAELTRLGWPDVLPGDEHALVTVGRADGSSGIAVVALRDGALEPVAPDGTFARHLSAAGVDYVLYVNQGTLFALPFDLRRFAASGAALPVLDDVAYAASFGYAQLDISANGVLAYRRDAGLRSLAWLDRHGAVEPLPLPAGRYVGPRLSPDGSRALVNVVESGVQRLLIYELAQSRARRLDATLAGAPVWRPDGRSALVGAPDGLAWVPLYNDGTPRSLNSPGLVVPWSSTADGRIVAYSAMGATTHFDLWTVPVSGAGDQLEAGPPTPYLRTAAIETWPAFSLDGRWIAHASNESGTFEVYVRSFPDNGTSVQVSQGGGRIPFWSPNGRELLYQTDDERIMVTEYAVVDGEFVVSQAPREWTPVRLADTGVLPAFDLAPDRERVLALLPQPPEMRASPNHATFIFNFADRLER